MFNWNLYVIIPLAPTKRKQRRRHPQSDYVPVDDFFIFNYLTVVKSRQLLEHMIRHFYLI